MVSIPSVSHAEKEIADFVEDLLGTYPYLRLRRIGNNIAATAERGFERKVILAGHLDTVPVAGLEASLAPDAVSGRGSVDMKGGLAVLIRLAANAESFPLNTAFIFYAKEEVKRLDSGLLEIEQAAPELLTGNLAVLAEPTNTHVELGCQGVMRVVVRLGGKSAHSARPWAGVNAIHRLGVLLERVNSFGRREIGVDGLLYAESLQAVKIEGGTGKNVVPDQAAVTLSYRFSPASDTESAYAFLCKTFEDVIDPELGDEITVEEAAPSALPHLFQDGVQKLIALTGKEPVAKLGWTDVAFFSERGIASVNFGPGDAEMAHGPREVIGTEQLENCYAVLRQFLSVPDPACGQN